MRTGTRTSGFLHARLICLNRVRLCSICGRLAFRTRGYITESHKYIHACNRCSPAALEREMKTLDLNPRTVRVTISSPGGLLLASGIFPTKTAFTYLLASIHAAEEVEGDNRRRNVLDGNRCGIGNRMGVDDEV